MKADMSRGYSYWNAVLLNVKDDPDLVYALSLDALYKWRDNGEGPSLIIKILEDYRLSCRKLEGITYALLEYQLLEHLPENVISMLMRVVEMRIFDDDEGREKKWIDNFLTILRKQFSNSNFKWIVSMIYDRNNRLPSLYSGSLINILRDYSERYGNSVDFKEYLDGEVARIKKDLLKVRIEGESKELTKIDREIRMQLLGALACSGFWANISTNILTRTRIRIKELILSSLFDNATAFSFMGATALIVALVGYFINEKWGVVVFPAIYVIICIILMPRLRRKYKGEEA
jgi:hypothetical protein